VLTAEAEWLEARLAGLTRADAPLLNVGSASAAFRREVQPWIEARVFAPLSRREIAVLHQDLAPAPGVDLVGDLGDPAVCAEIARHGVRSIVCSNVLEHVVERERIAGALAALLPPGGRLFVTVPHRFPHHPDPIDTMYRPTVPELLALFPALRLVASAALPCGRLHDLVLQNPRRLIEKLGERSAARRAGPSPLRAAVRWLPWIVRPFVVTCAELVKPR